MEVGESTRSPGQGSRVDVAVRWDAPQRRFFAEPDKLRLGANEFVLWHLNSTTPGVPPSMSTGSVPYTLSSTVARSASMTFPHTCS
jgi:hypothetical protein